MWGFIVIFYIFSPYGIFWSVILYATCCVCLKNVQIKVRWAVSMQYANAWSVSANNNFTFEYARKHIFHELLWMFQAHCDLSKYWGLFFDFHLNYFKCNFLSINFVKWNYYSLFTYFDIFANESILFLKEKMKQFNSVYN